MKYSVRAMIIIAFLSMSFIPVFGQTGAWIEYSFTAFGNGSRIWKCGENCLGYTYANATRIVFFDITNSTWQEANFASTQHFHNLTARGNLVFAATDSFLIAYNGLTSHWDTTRFEGEPLDTTSASPDRRSYQVGDNLAIYVTDLKFYVFDVAVDHWQEHAYTLPENYVGGVFWVGDTYAGVMLNPSMDIPTNLAYSAYTHDFAETDRGMYLGGGSDMLDGFAGSYIYGSADDYYLVGYSAISNQFTRIEVDADYAPDSGIHLTENKHTEFTVYEATARTVVTPYELVRLDVWCYDTRLGAWTHQIYEYDPGESGGFGAWYLGGRFAYIPNNDDETDNMIVFLYSGLTGNYSSIETGLGYWYPHGTTIQGRTIMAFGDSTNVYACNIETGQAATISVGADYYRRNISGHDYLTFNRYDNSDFSTTYFYHGPSNTWTAIPLENAIYTVNTAGSHVYLETTSGENCGALFYSPILNETHWEAFPANSAIFGVSSNYLAVADGPDYCVLYDAHTGTPLRIDVTTVSSNSLTDNIMFIGNAGDNTFYAYSSITHSLSTLAVESSPYRSFPINYIGLGYIGSNATEFYAYNGFYGNFVELVPAQNNVGQATGGKTALVIRTNTLYAFDPQAPPTGVDESSDNLLPGKFSLAQNYPNPFNAGTIISYNLKYPGDVNVKIYDVLGRLVDLYEFEDQSAGAHQFIWRGDNYSSGTYFYKLDSGAFSETRKMTLLK